MDSNKQNKSGFSFADDLMVDITGALFPGLMFIVILFISVVIPLMIYDDSQIFTIKEISGSQWWVILIILLIVSYVVGYIFCRADVIEPDKKDIKRRIKEELNKGRKKYRKNLLYKEIETELREQIRAFLITLRNYEVKLTSAKETQKENNDVDIYGVLTKNCKKVVEEGIVLNRDYPSELLSILFPEEVRTISNKSNTDTADNELSYRNLNNNIRQSLEEYREYICSTKHEVIDEPTLKLIVCSCVLNIQSELGCLNTRNCTFPYVYYYKYLLKRNLTDYLGEVKWNNYNTRSKNIINDYKIEIQLFAPDAYALIRKNESHIRMSSSTWHMAQPLKWISGLMSIIMFVALLLNYNSYTPWSFGCCLGFHTLFYGSFISFIVPFSMLVFLTYIQQRITLFIHYQRMREIFYTISIYDDYKDIIKDKKKVKSDQKNYNVNVHESKLYLV